MRYKHHYIYILIVLSIILVRQGFGQSPNCEGDSYGVSMDSSIRIMQLPNGFRYYIKNLKTPSDKIRIELVVKAGTRNQRPGEWELAHLIEHLAFEGTRRFPQDSVMRYLSRRGLMFGREFTAYTGDVKTGYSITIPVGDTALLRNSIAIARDWAQDLTFEPGRIMAQKGAVMSEIRMRSMTGSSDVLFETNRLLLNNDSYGPMDFNEHYKGDLMNLTRETIIDFYEDWYTPDRQALMIVGDIDVDMVQNYIEREFSNMKARVASRSGNRKDWAARLTGENRFLPIVKPGIANIQLSINYKRPHKMSQFVKCGDYSELVKALMAETLISSRFRQMPQQYNSPTLNAILSENMLNSGIDLLTLHAELLEPSHVVRTCEVAAAEIGRIRLIGFTQEEFENAKAEVLQTIKKKPKRPNDIARMTSHFVDGINVRDSEVERAILSRFVSDMKLSDVNLFIRTWFDFDINRDVILVVPDQLSPSIPKSRDVRKAFSNGTNSKVHVASVVSRKSPASLMNGVELERLNDTCRYVIIEKDSSKRIVRFRNGATVVFLPGTGLKNGEVILRAYRPGGASRFEGTEKFIAQNAGQIVSASGLAGLDKFALGDYLSNKGVRVWPYVDDIFNRLNGSCRREELETLLHATYLFFTRPQCIQPAFDEWLSRKKLEMLRTKVDPMAMFWGKIAEQVDGKRTFGEEYLDSVNCAIALEVYKEGFSDASEFTFFFFGDFEIDDRFLWLVSKFIGNLPSSRSEQVNASLGNYSFQAQGSMSKEYEYGNYSNKADVVMYFPLTNRKTSSVKTDLALLVMTRIFRNAILQRLRTEEGAAYTPEAVLFQRQGANGEMMARISLSFECDPQVYKKAVNSAGEVFLQLIRNVPDRSEFEIAKAQIKEWIRYNSKDVHIFLDEVVDAHYSKRELLSAQDRLHLIDEIGIADVMEVIVEYLRPEAIQRFVLLPKKV
jgi:zinc protease